MAIKKQFLKTKPVCKVTFNVTADAERLSVVGDFNNWNVEAMPLKKLKNGSFKGQLNIEKGLSYEFRYVTNEGQYFNDDQADSYQLSEYSGSVNGVLNL